MGHLGLYSSQPLAPTTTSQEQSGPALFNFHSPLFGDEKLTPSGAAAHFRHSSPALTRYQSSPQSEPRMRVAGKGCKPSLHSMRLWSQPSLSWNVTILQPRPTSSLLMSSGALHSQPLSLPSGLSALCTLAGCPDFGAVELLPVLVQLGAVLVADEVLQGAVVAVLLGDDAAAEGRAGDLPHRAV